MVMMPSPAVFHCPSRRPAVLYKVEAHHTKFAANATPNASPTDFYVGSSDYAANAGDGAFLDSQGPPTWQAGQNKGSAAFDLWTQYTNTIGLQTRPGSEPTWVMTGVMFQRSEVGMKHIVDGASKTYLLGERYLNAINYNRDTIEGGDDWGWAWGFSDDNERSTHNAPLQDFPFVSSKDMFGSAHAGAFHMAYCDGHVEAVNYDIDLLVHQRSGNRRDGEVQ